MATRARFSLTPDRFDRRLAANGAVTTLVQAPQKMDIEIVFFITRLTANCAFEGVGFVVTAHVQSVHHLVSKSNVAEAAGSVPGHVD